MGAEDLATMHKALYSFQDRHIPDTLFRENTFLQKSAGFGCRMARLLLLDAQEDEFISLVQHEVFGHGARLRELGYEKNAYGVNMFFPFGDGHGFAQYGTLQSGYQYPTIHERIAVDIAGVDAQILLGSTITEQALLDDSLHFRQGVLYLVSQNNQLAYLFRTKDVINPQSRDMSDYVHAENSIYHRPNSRSYSVRQLFTQDLVSFANPFQFYAAWSVFYTYGIKGRKKLNGIPMIRIGQVRYLPAINYSLTPFGSQYHFINYVRYRRMLFSADLMKSDNTFNDFYGISLKAFNLLNTSRIALNLHLDVWEQPTLYLDNYTLPKGASKPGGSFKADVTFRPVTLPDRLGLFVQAGYKTSGYLTGDVLANGFMLRGGIGMHL